MVDGISRQGRDSELQFRALVQGSRDASEAAAGDAVVEVDGTETSVEIKKCDSKTGSGTINQVRAIKFIPMVVHNPALNEWYVVPATELVRFASAKARGQHTEVSFESMNLSLRNVTKWRRGPHQLDVAVRAAIRFDRGHPELLNAMVALLRELKDIASRTRPEIDKLLARVAEWNLP